MGNSNNYYDKYEKMINAFQEKTVKSAIEGFLVDLNDDLTNNVRDYLDLQNNEELVKIQKFLNKLLNLLYNCELYEMQVEQEEINLINNLSEKDKFEFKETVIYFSGRLPIKVDLELLKKVYYLDNNKYIKMNLTFATLQMFDEEIELDFVDKVVRNPEYDEMIRSWTMAFFRNEVSPYEYKDKRQDDWTVAKMPRIKRLKIDDKENPKYKKAMAYRLMDLVVIYLFLRNRNKNSLQNEEKDIIENASIDFELYSENKKAIINELKKKILEI